MRQYIGYIQSLLKTARNLGIVVFIFIAMIGVFLRFTTPLKIPESESPRMAMVQREKEILETLKDYKPKTENDKKLLSSVEYTYCALFGMICDKDTSTFSEKDFDNSIMGKTAGVMAIPFTNPPASGTYYAFHSFQQAGFIPRTYAAEGLGFAGLVPFINIWKKLRDIALLIIALAVVVSGFLILFRSKMDPQNTVKIENALPKIILAIILINFSYAIAGFMIDLMYIFSGLVIVTFGPLVDPALSIGSLLDRYLNPRVEDLIHLGIGNYSGGISGLLSAFWGLIYELPRAIVGVFGDTLRTIIITIIRIFLFPYLLFGSWRVFGFIADKVDSLPFGIDVIIMVVGFFLAFPIAWYGSLYLPFIVIGVAILLSFFLLIIKLMFIIFKTYLKLLFYIMLSPLILLLEAFPNSKAFIPWAQTIFVELLTFPTMLAIFFLAGAFRFAIIQGNLFRLPYGATLNTESFAAIVGYGTLFLMPQMIELMKKKLNTDAIQGPNIGIGMFFEPVMGIGSHVNKRAASLTPTSAKETFIPMLRLFRRARGTP